MKLIQACFLLFLPLMAFKSPNTTTEASIVGKWEIKEGGISEYMVFHANGSLELILEEDAEEIPDKMTYAVDKSKTPHHLDLILGEGSAADVAKCIYRLPTSNTLEIGGVEGSSKIRPKEFSEDNSIFFTRVTQEKNE